VAVTHELPRVALLSRDPELVEDLDPDERRRAQHVATAPLLRLPAGAWDSRPVVGLEPTPGHLGLLVLDGLLLRGLDLEGAACAEVVGVGDVIRPWTADIALGLANHVSWEIVGDVQVAVLDRRATAVLGHWPEVMARLMDRAIRRSHSLAFHLAVCAIPRVDLRLLAVLWNLADRWGKMTREGVVLPLPLTHRVLAQLVAARRPSVTTQLGRLRERGLVVAREGGGWRLDGEPPEELEAIRSQLADHTAAPPRTPPAAAGC